MQVLVVDDQEAVRTALELLFELEGLECLTARTPDEAVDLVRLEDVGVVVQDMNFAKNTTSGEEGVELFQRLRALDPELPVILLTAWGSLETAVALTKSGAHDYLEKPWDDAKLAIVVKNALQLREVTRERQQLLAHDRRSRARLAERYDLRGLIYESRAMHEVVSLAVHVAASDAPVLITGPNGGGKERIAEIVQANSRRADKPFVRVNAGGLPDELLDAELFGAEAGAFTGATKLRVGRFEAANGGTLFLDELGNLSMAGQMKLLRVLQSGEFQRLGSNTTRQVDVRLISATNADLQRAIAEGRFREDLYFRLNVIELEVKPLAERRADILPLALGFLSHAPEGRRELTDEAKQALLDHDWPGNVRELENRIQRALLVADAGSQVVTAKDLGLSSRGEIGVDGGQSVAVATRHAEHSSRSSSQELPAEGALAAAERAAIDAALQRADGVISRAATELGLSRQALYRRMQRFGISIERKVR